MRIAAIIGLCGISLLCCQGCFFPRPYPSDIGGCVVDAETGRPIRGAVVIVGIEQYRRQDRVFLPFMEWAKVYTDSAGRFRWKSPEMPVDDPRHFWLRYTIKKEGYEPVPLNAFISGYETAPDRSRFWKLKPLKVKPEHAGDADRRDASGARVDFICEKRASADGRKGREQITIGGTAIPSRPAPVSTIRQEDYTFVTLVHCGREFFKRGERFHPFGVAVDSSGNIYVADMGDDAIRKVTPAGAITAVTGRGGPKLFRFCLPRGVAVDSSCNVYMADSGSCAIYKVSPAGEVAVLAGKEGECGGADGKGGAARFRKPHGVAVDSSGSVYVADTYNHAIRKITPDGLVMTMAGCVLCEGSADGIGGTARFYAPHGVAVDSSGNVYVADTNNHTIRRITPEGIVTTLAGQAGREGLVDGKEKEAAFRYPRGIAVDSSGNIFVSDSDNHAIRKITTDGVVTTIAGGDTKSYEHWRDGTGGAAMFYYPNGIAFDSFGNLYVADTGNCMIRKGAKAATDRDGRDVVSPTAGDK